MAFDTIDDDELRYRISQGMYPEYKIRDYQAELDRRMTKNIVDVVATTSAETKRLRMIEGIAYIRYQTSKMDQETAALVINELNAMRACL